MMDLWKNLIKEVNMLEKIFLSIFQFFIIIVFFISFEMVKIEKSLKMSILKLVLIIIMSFITYSIIVYADNKIKFLEEKIEMYEKNMLERKTIKLFV